jgi:hypothetical protein
MLRNRTRIQMAKSVSIAALTALGVTAGALGNVTFAAATSMPHTVKMTLSKSIPPSPVFLTQGVCGYSGPSDTAACNSTIIKAIDAARKSEPLAAIPASFNLSAFDALTPERQVFAIADIERTARGLPPMAGMTAQLDAIAQSASNSQGDPSTSLPLHLTTGGTATTYGSNWAEGTANGLGSDYFWMYDDGLNSPNATCTKSDESSCWGHRENVLYNYENANYCPKGSKINLVMGIGETTSKVSYDPSIAEIYVNDCGALPTDMVFTWTDVQQLVFGH